VSAATESLAQALRQLEVYGRDGLPVLSADGKKVDGWVTDTSVLRAIASQITSSRADAARAQLAADWDHGDEAALLRQPATPLPGYQVIELTVSGTSPAAGARLGTITWPPGTAPVSVLRDHSHRNADPAITLRPGDRITLLAPAPAPAERTEPPGGNPASLLCRTSTPGSHHHVPRRPCLHLRPYRPRHAARPAIPAVP
jgi:chloride channel protein, CIC family